MIELDNNLFTEDEVNNYTFLQAVKSFEQFSGHYGQSSWDFSIMAKEIITNADRFFELQDAIFGKYVDRKPDGSWHIPTEHPDYDQSIQEITDLRNVKHEYADKVEIIRSKLTAVPKPADYRVLEPILNVQP